MWEWIIIFVTTTILVHWYRLKPRGFPPGPPTVPLLGALPFLTSKNFHYSCEHLRERFGPVIGLKIGTRNAVAICGPKEVEDVLRRDEFQGRPRFVTEANAEEIFFREGIMFSEGHVWSEQRRFTMRHLRDFGFGKRSTENVMLEEAEEFFENCLRNKETVQVSNLFNVSAINIIWAIIAGKRFSYKDKEFQLLLNLLTITFRSGNVTGGFFAVFPMLRKVFPKWSGLADDVETKSTLKRFFTKLFEEHRSTREEDPRDFIDVYQLELEKTEDLKPSFSEERLISVCNDLFSAGSESSGNTLGFCLLYMVLHPEWQEKLSKEIDSVLAGRQPSLDDRENLPQVDAFITEVFRCNTIAPFTVPHRAIKDAYLNGHFIPANSMVLVSLWSVLQDKKHWGDPENFRPERFLNEDGTYRRDPYMYSFGLGKRTCPGDMIAKNIIFLFFVSMVQEFKFGIPPGHPKPSTVCLPGFTTAPQPFEVTVKSRLK